MRGRARVAKRDQLAARPSRALGWMIEEAGQVKREAWLTASEESRRQLCFDAGLRYLLGRGAERGYFEGWA